jgi:hypothetical protein
MTARLNPPVITTASLLLHHSPGHDLEAGAPETTPLIVIGNAPDCSYPLSDFYRTRVPVVMVLVL